MECRRKYLKSRICVRAFANDSKISNIISSAFLIQMDDGQSLMSRRVYCKNIIQACRRKYLKNRICIRAFANDFVNGARF